MFLTNYHYILLNYTSVLQHQHLWRQSMYVLFILLIQSVKGGQLLLNIDCLFSLSVVLNAVVVPTPTTVMDPLTSIYAS